LGIQAGGEFSNNDTACFILEKPFFKPSKVNLLDRHLIARAYHGRSQALESQVGRALLEALSIVSLKRPNADCVLNRTIEQMPRPASPPRFARAAALDVDGLAFWTALAHFLASGLDNFLDYRNAQNNIARPDYGYVARLDPEMVGHMVIVSIDG